MNNQPGGLIDHDQMLVLERDRQRNILRLVVRRGGGGDRHRERVAARRLARRIAHGSARARHLPGGDQHLQSFA